MSQPLSPSRLAYARDFLLKYQHIYTPDPTITARLSPYLSPPRSNQTSKRQYNGKKVSPGDNLDQAPTTQRLTKPNTRKKFEKGQAPKLRDTQVLPTSFKLKTVGQNQVQFANNENAEPIVNTNSYKPIKNPSLSTSAPQTYSCVLQASTFPRTAGQSGTLPTFVSQLSSSASVDIIDLEVFDEQLFTTPVTSSAHQVGFCESKFASLFPQSQIDLSTELSLDLLLELKSKLSFALKDDDTSILNPNPEHQSSFSNFMTNPLTMPGPDTTCLNTSNPIPSPRAFPTTPTPKLNSSVNILSTSDSKTPVWSPSDTERTTDTPTQYTKSPDSTPFKSVVSTPFRSSKTPVKSHHSIPTGRPISPLDEQRLVQRQKQIDYGYRTVGYLRYRLLVSKEKRKPEHPRTPKKAQGCSKRSWDGQLKKWRRDLHLWDPDNMEAFKALLNSELVESIITGNPELAEIVRVVRDKLENPTPNDDGDDECDDSEDQVSSPDDVLPRVIKNESATMKSCEPRLDRVARTLVF